MSPVGHLITSFEAVAFTSPVSFTLQCFLLLPLLKFSWLLIILAGLCLVDGKFNLKRVKYIAKEDAFDLAYSRKLDGFLLRACLSDEIDSTRMC